MARRPRREDVRGRSPARVAGAAAAVVLVAAWVFLPVLGFALVNYDDPAYVRDNPHVHAGLGASGVAWAFTTGHASNWHPLTWLSHMADVELFGLDPGAHHRTSLVLHVVSSVLLLLLVRSWTGSLGVGTAVAALFAWHPAHVESVAWVSERKDVLSALLLWLALAAYTAHARQRAPRVLSPRSAAVAVLLALALMAKPMAVSAPFLMLLLDVWPLGRLSLGEGRLWPRARPLVVEKLPFFALAAAASAVTLAVQGAGGAVTDLAHLPLPGRVAHAVVAGATYLGILAWPAGLAVFYPHRGWPSPFALLASAALLLALSWGAWRLRRGSPFLLVGWLWFLGTLVPVIGLVQVGEQALADRYTYVPSVGLGLALAEGVRRLLAVRPALGRSLAALGTVALVAFAPLARAQVQHWRDSVTLFRRAVSVTRDNHVAERQLGTALLAAGDAAGAEPHLREAVRLRPRSAEAWNALGVALTRLGREGDAGAAVEAFRRAVAAAPADPEPRHNLGNALSAQGQGEAALAEHREAVRLVPDDPAGHRNVGLTLAGLGRLDEARRELEEALRLDSGDAATAGDLGNVLAQLGRADEALERYRGALRLDPRAALVRHNLARHQARTGKLREAAAELRQGLGLDPDDHVGRQLLVQVYLALGRVANAEEQLAILEERAPALASELRRQLAAASTGPR